MGWRAERPQIDTKGDRHGSKMGLKMVRGGPRGPQGDPRAPVGALGPPSRSSFELPRGAVASSMANSMSKGLAIELAIARFGVSFGLDWGVFGVPFGAPLGPRGALFKGELNGKLHVNGACY